jgi:hypothetical protein
LLLCGHAEELSAHCALAIRSGAMEGLPDLQARKQTVIKELSVILRELDPAGFPDLQHAVESLREALRAETGLLMNASSNFQNELLTVGVAQRRLSQARRYNNAAQPLLPIGGGHLSVCG